MGQLDAVVSAVQGVLGSNLVGAYQYGSGVSGGLRPASDLDVLAVIERPLAPAARRALADAVMAVSGARAGGRPVELTVVVRSEVVPWRYPPLVHLLYGEWLADDFAAGDTGAPHAEPNLAIELTQVLDGGRVLTGPAPASLLSPVPTRDVVRASLDGIPALLADLEGDERNVLLTFARIWCTVETGGIVSKDRAAAWAAPRLPAELRPPLEHARSLYLTSAYRDETWPAGLREAVATVIAHIVDRLSDAPRAPSA